MTIGETFRIAIIGNNFFVEQSFTFYLLDLGGGPAGLSLAIGLKKKGFQNIIIYERETSKRNNDSMSLIDFILLDEQVRHQGWSISLFSPGGGLEYIEHLGLLPELTPISYVPCFRALDGETGQFISRLYYHSSMQNMIGKVLLHKVGKGNGRRFKRGDLREALHQICLREGKFPLVTQKILQYR